MYMYLFLLCFLYSVNVYVFIPMVLFMIINDEKWVYIRIGFLRLSALPEYPSSSDD